MNIENKRFTYSKTLFISYSLLVGLVCLWIHISYNSFNYLFETQSVSRVLVYTQYFEMIVLPRSLFEIDTINEQLGTSYSNPMLLMEVFCSLFFIFNIRRSTLKIKNVSSTTCKIDTRGLLADIFVSICALFLRFPMFERASLSANYIDKNGLFIVRESVLISIGYYFFSDLIISAFLYRNSRKRLQQYAELNKKSS